MPDFQEMAARLRRLADGRAEWRVRHPTEHCYCMSFDRLGSVDPEGDARQWLADFKRKFPNHPHAGYEVAEVRVFTELEQAALDVAEVLASSASNAGVQPAQAIAALDAAMLKAPDQRVTGVRLEGTSGVGETKND